MINLLTKIVEAICEALPAGDDDAKKLAGALILSGVLKAAAAVYLIVFKPPGGLLANDSHGKLLFDMYYGILAGTVVFGLTEASTGFWVSGDLTGRRRAVGRTFLWVSILPLVIVAGLGGFAFAMPK